MRIITSFMLSSAVLLGVAARGAAQDRPADLLNSLEVRQLISRGDAADHAKLRSHYVALAARYEASAKRHASMAAGFARHPSRSLGAGMSVHCKRLAALDSEAAAVVRELADYHATRADGVSAVVPREAAKYEAGEGAPAPTDQEVVAMVSTAFTAADHRFLEQYFRTEAGRYAAESASHASTARTYRQMPRNPMAGAAQHCEKLAAAFTTEAKEASEAAAMHHEMAASAR